MDSFLADGFEMGRQLIEGNTTKAELLAPRQERGRYRLGLGGGENEDQVSRGLLDNLEECVKGLPREAVNLVEDDDFVTIPSRSVPQAFGELAHLVDLGVGRGVELQDIEIVATGDLYTGRALIAGIGSRPPFAVEGLGEDSGDARFFRHRGYRKKGTPARCVRRPKRCAEP